MTLNRRDFLKTSFGAAGIVATTGLTGCASVQTGSTGPKVVVVGAGPAAGDGRRARAPQLHGTATAGRLDAGRHAGGVPVGPREHVQADRSVGAGVARHDREVASCGHGDVLVDGDGGDENLKDYPIEENPELTIRSVVNNLMLYHEGWGVGRLKHSLTYSGGLSRSYTRTYAPARAFGWMSRASCVCLFTRASAPPWYSA